MECGRNAQTCAENQSDFVYEAKQQIEKPIKARYVSRDMSGGISYDHLDSNIYDTQLARVTH